MNHLALSKFFLVLGLLLAGSLAIAQGMQQSGGESSITISSISPPISTLLRPGDKVKFEVEVEYTLAAERGGVALVVQRAEPGHSPIGHTGKHLAKGTGKIVLVVEAEIPVTRTIQIFVPLYTDVAQSTSIVDGRVYEVARK